MTLNTLKQAEIFYQLTPSQLEMINNIGTEVTYPDGSIVFNENDRSKELYAILDGEVEIILGEEGKKLATLRRGQSFGEVALVDEGVRSATARTKGKTRLLVIPRDKLLMLCETYPQMGYRLMYNLAADLAMKIRHTDLKIQSDAPPGE